MLFALTLSARECRAERCTLAEYLSGLRPSQGDEFNERDT